MTYRYSTLTMGGLAAVLFFIGASEIIIAAPQYTHTPTATNNSTAAYEDAKEADGHKIQAAYHQQMAKHHTARATAAREVAEHHEKIAQHHNSLSKEHVAAAKAHDKAAAANGEMTLESF